MNAVGSGDVPAGQEEDPLAQLKAEAQEAKMNRELQNARRLSSDEIAELESGMNARGEMSGKVEVAVAAPADIARLEEEANMKVFNTKSGQGSAGSEKKKPWWKFGF